ncbi:MAG: hypothetical protein PHS14_05945 [Elusimicrobia bacterium]|nr:hypothetical protein [Elusimicrobiota bacterium]
MAPLPETYKIKSFLVEARFKPHFSINSTVWEVLDNFPTPDIGFLTSGGVEGRDKIKSSQYQVEFNRASHLVENIDNAEGLKIWISKAASLINHVINKWDISKIERLGIRLHLLVTSPEIQSQGEYSKLLAQGVDIVSNGDIPTDVLSTGFVFRFKKNPWGVRFGSFSSDYEVVKKYHKYVERESIFSNPGILFDIDCFQFNLDSTPSKQLNGKFDVSSFVNGAHILAAELVQKHVMTINKRGDK